LPCFHLEPFQDVDDIIEQYADYWASRKPELLWASEAKGQIKCVSRDNLWLLAYALDGYRVADGRGEPHSWIEVGVREDLQDLRNCGDTHASRYPEVVVELAPLYKNEVMTAEEYLVDELASDTDVLRALTVRGEIIRDVTRDGEVYYGLPHSALADDYWEHWREYIQQKKLRELEEFIYNYATSGALNALEAVMEHKKVQDAVIVRLENENRIMDIVRKEHHLFYVGAYLNTKWPKVHIIEEDTVDFLNEDFARMLADKICNQFDSFGATMCIHSVYNIDYEKGVMLASVIDPDKVRGLLNEDPFTPFSLIAAFYVHNARWPYKVLDPIDIDKYSTALMQCQSPEVIYHCVADMCKWHGEKGQDLVNRVANELSNRLGSPEEDLRIEFKEICDTFSVEYDI